MNPTPLSKPIPLASLMAALVIGALAYAVTATIVPTPAQAQGTLTAPAGQKRVTAPGGLRGRAALRHRRMHKRHR